MKEELERAVSAPPAISVIVPVYNAEKYLQRCVDSVLAQTFTDFELLLIDDGSKDKSGTICDEYTAKDNRIRVYHNANGGVTFARNFGAEHAEGEWFCFLDADDTMPADALAAMMNKGNGCDVVIGNKRIVDGVTLTNEWQNKEYSRLSAREFLERLIKNEISQYITGRMFRRILFNNGTIDIPRELIMAEDFIMNVQLGNKAQKIAIIQDVVYDYHVYDESVSHTFNTSIEYENKFCHCLFSALKQGEYYDEVKEAFIFQKVRALKSAFMAQYGQLDLRHPFVLEVCQEAKLIKMSKGWRLFLVLLPLKRISYAFFKLLN